MVYISNKDNVKQLDKEISLQYNLGTYDYEESINKVKNTVTIRKDLK